MKIQVAAIALAVLIASCGGRNDAAKHGKTLVAEYKVPAATLIKFEALKPSERKAGESVLEATMLADGEAWTGPSLDLDSTTNPYKIAVTLSGRVKADGDAISMWKVGWNFGEDGSRLTLMPGLTRSNLKAGESFSATAVSDPISLKKDRTAQVVLELVNAGNIEFDGVDVSVWSGLGGTSFLQKFGAFTYVAIGLVMLAIWWFWFRRPRTDADL
jgi:hypothetical protein